MQLRNREVDIIKGLSIILMVYGHAYGVFRNWIYLFHMPVFFMVSGYCWKRTHTENADSVRKYVFDRFLKLMVPYFTCCIFFTILNNQFVKLNIYTTNLGLLDDNYNIPFTQKLADAFDSGSLLHKIYQVFTFEYSPQAAAAMWFLYALAAVCLIHCGIEYGIRRIRNKLIAIVIYVAIVALLFFFSWDVSAGFGTLRNFMYSRHYRIFSCYLAYLLGVGMQKAKNIKLWGIWQGLLAFALLCILDRFGTLEMSKAEIVNPFFMVAASLCGWVFLGSFARLLSLTPASGLFEYIGRNTLPVMALHVLSFKVISLIFVVVKHEPLYRIASFPVIFETSELMRLMYTFTGVGLSLCVFEGYRFIKYRLVGKNAALILLSLCVLVFGATVFGNLFVSNKNSVTSEGFIKTGNVGQITEGKEIKQNISIENGELTGIRLYVATYNRINDCVMDVALLKDDETIQEWQITCSGLNDNTYVPLVLDESMQVEADRTYCIKLTSDGIEGNAVTVYTSTKGDQDGLFINGKERFGESLCYQIEGIYDKSITPIEYIQRAFFALVLIAIILYYFLPVKKNVFSEQIERQYKV